MATNEDEIISQWEINLREQKEILSQCFSEARRKLDERERVLIERLEKLFKEDEMRFKKQSSDKQQLTSALNQLQSALTSESLLGTGKEAILLVKNKLNELERGRMKVQFNWSKNNLFSEISKIGEFTVVPVLTYYNLDSIGKETKSECISLVTAPSRAEQEREIHDLLNRPLQLETPDCYLICSQWFNQWKRFIGYDVVDQFSYESYPGPIDNTALLENGKLKPNKLEKIDYTLLSETTWYRLVSWYGVTEGLVGIKRKVVGHVQSVKEPKVEVYPLELSVCFFPNEKSYSITMSRVDTINTLEKRLRGFFKIASDKLAQIYKQVQCLPLEPIQDMKSQIQEVLFSQENPSLQEHNLLIATQTNGRWPTPAELEKFHITRSKQTINLSAT